MKAFFVKKKFSLFFFFFLFANTAFADLSFSPCDPHLSGSCFAKRVLFYAPNSTEQTFAPPSATLQLSQLQLTYPITLDVSNAKAGFQYDPKNWGVLFSEVSGSGTPVAYFGAGTYDGNTSVQVSVDTQNLTVSGLKYSGTVVVTLSFANTNDLLTSDITGLIKNSALLVQPFYNQGTKNNLTTSDSQLTLLWQADEGALLSAPQVSALAQDGGFVVLLKPPAQSFAAVAQNNVLVSTTNNFSGYVLAYWLERDAQGNLAGCGAAPGSWQFLTNPVALGNVVPGGTPESCTHTPYDPSFHTGGHVEALGCVQDPGILPFDSSLSLAKLTPDQAAIPNTPGYSNPTQLPQDSNGLPSGCYQVVYVPANRSSWGKSNIRNGDVYGVTAWALNYRMENEVLQPFYSLAHAPLVYITGVDLPFASLDKNSNLKKTPSDCFVVTAASGSSNSPAVFYWRILRDEYLTPWGVTPFYYRHAKVWARFLDDHPRLKPPVHFLLDKSGQFFYHGSLFFKKIKKTFLSLWSSQEAHAAQIKQPHYDLFLGGSLFFPTDDRFYYNKYYFQQPQWSLEGGASQLFWIFGDQVPLALSSGILGRYLTNSQEASVDVLGEKQFYQRRYFFLMAEAILGLRFRHPQWLFMQPEFFCGFGLTRFREEVSLGREDTFGGNSEGQNLLGVTKWSPVMEYGLSLDLSLVPLFSLYPGDLGVYLRDILFRISVSSLRNPSPALSSTGFFVGGSFLFLLD